MIAIIPCRSGSKSIKDKNLLQLEGKTLVRIAVDIARSSGIFTKVVVSTDYPRYKLDIEDLGSTMFTEMIYLPRPEHLCGDNVMMIDVIKSVLSDIKGSSDGWVWLLQPTSPFRSISDFKAIHKAIKTGEYEAAISFKPAGEYIDRLYTWKDGSAHRLFQTNYKNKQELKNQVTRSGNYYVTKRKHIEENGDSKKWTWEIKPYFSYMMGGVDPETSTPEQLEKSKAIGINIDSKVDWELAKGAVRRGDFRI